MTRPTRLILQGYHAKNAKPYLDLDPEELTRARRPGRVAATSAQTVLKEWLAGAPERRPQGRGPPGLPALGGGRVCLRAPVGAASPLPG